MGPISFWACKKHASNIKAFYFYASQMLRQLDCEKKLEFCSIVSLASYDKPIYCIGAFHISFLLKSVIKK